MKVKIPTSCRERVKIMAISIVILLFSIYFFHELYQGISRMELPVLDKSMNSIKQGSWK